MTKQLYVYKTFSLFLGLLWVGLLMGQTKNLYTSPITGKNYDIYKTAQTFPQKDFNGERRFALIIAMSEYKFMDRLPNCFNDAEAMKIKLIEAGFDVMLINDSPYLGTMRNMIKDAEGFYKKNTYNIALVYYSGHGVQLGDMNWMVPTSLKGLTNNQSKNIKHLSDSCMRWGEVLQPFLRQNDTKQVIAILDACRSFDYIVNKSGLRSEELTAIINNEVQIMSDKRLTRIFSNIAGKESRGKHPESNYSYFTHYLLQCFNSNKPSPCSINDLKRDLNNLMESAQQEPLVYSAPGPYEFNFYNCIERPLPPLPDPKEQIGSNFSFSGSVSDIEGNTYKTIKIGEQWWMAENLKTSQYRNLSPIDNLIVKENWKNVKTGAWCYYENSEQNNQLYGKLYNWYAVTDNRGLCPIGWHIPSDDEWTILTKALGGNSIAGAKMKSTLGWYESPIGASGNIANTSGFNGLPSGHRYGDSGDFGDVGNTGNWWSSTQSSTEDAWIRYLNDTHGDAFRDKFSKRNGFSVRCLRDE